MMFRYRDDEEYYDRPDPVYARGCTCKNWHEEPCSYCQGDYSCPGGCGYVAGDCQCPPTWDELSEEDQMKRIKEAFEYLCDSGEVPYGVMVGDDCTWDTYDPAIELAEEWYGHERVG